MNSDRYVARGASRRGVSEVVIEGTADLPEGVDAVLLVRSTLERPAMHNAVIALHEYAFLETWPPSDPAGGDKAHYKKG